MAASASAPATAANTSSSSSGSATSSQKQSLFEDACEADEDELAFVCEEPHIMAVYNFASTVAFDFGFDRAKEMIEHDQREGLRGLDPPYAASKWSKFFAILSQFAVAEKQYMSASYLTPPQGFLGRAMARDNWLRNMFGSMSSELEKLEIFEEAPVLAELSSQLRLLVKTRVSLMSFYERLCQSALVAAAANASTQSSEFMDFEATRTEILKTMDLLDVEYHGCIRPIRTHVLQECQIVGGYIGCLAEIGHWRYNAALAPMTEAKRSYDRWMDAMKVWRDSKKTGGIFSSLTGETPEPYLFQWMAKLKAAVNDKYTFYFYQTLEGAAPSPQMFADKVQQSACVNYALRMQHFYKRCDALHVALVFDGASDPTYVGPGFQMPLASSIPGLFPIPSQRPSGVDLYPAMFSWPCDEAHTDSVRRRHWPSIVMTIASMQASRKREIRCGGDDGVVHVYDDRADVTYFVRRVGDPLVFAAVVFDSYRPDDELVVRGFLSELGAELNCAGSFTTLKQRTK